jgi:hypothetical protein
MDYVLTQYDAVPGGRVKLAATVQLALGLVASIWHPSLGGAAVAVLGILAVVLSNEELLKIFFYLEPFSAVIDVIQLFTVQRFGGWGTWVGFTFLGICVKLAGTYFAYELANTTGGDRSDYQQFGGPMPGAASRATFASTYHPPSTNSNLYSQPPQENGSPPRQQAAPQQPPNLV